MEMNTDRTTHIDAVRKKYGISLEAASKYNSLNGDEIKNSSRIFSLNGADGEKTLALLYMICAGEDDGVIRKFRAQAGLTDEELYSPALLTAKYGTMLITSLIYNPNLYAMALNYYGAVGAGFAVTDNAKKKNNIIYIGRLRFDSRIAYAAAIFAVIFFIALLFKINGWTRTDNEWIASLTAPQKGQDGVSFVHDGNEGARIGIMSPLVGPAMAADGVKTDVSSSIKYYTKAVKTEKNNAALYVNRGIAYTLQGNVDAAIADFNKAIELDPNNASAYFNRAAAFMGKDDAKMAIADLITVISINSNDSEAYYALGVLYFREYEKDKTKPRALLKKSLDAFSRIQGYKDADLIFDYLTRLL